MNQRNVQVDPKPFECIPHWLLFDDALTSNALRVWLILQKHRDYDTSECWPGRKLIAELSGLSIKTVDRSLAILSSIGAITITSRTNKDGSPASNLYHVHWDRWGNSDATVGTETTRGVGTKTTHEQRPTINKGPMNQSLPAVAGEESRPDVDLICNTLADLIEESGLKRPTITKEWRRQARLMIDKDEIPVGHIVGAIRWAHNDPFWASNILSVPTLRKQYPKLYMRAKNKPVSNVDGWLQLRQKFAHESEALE